MVSVRTLCGLTVLTLCLSACGAPGDGQAATPTPQFVVPSGVTGAPIPGPVPSSGPPPSSAAPSPSSKPEIKYAFPVRAENVDWHTTHSKYPATDLFADCGEPFVATTGGEVLEVSRTDEYVKGRPDGPLNGGLSVSILGDDGVRYYGSHLSRVAGGIDAGVRVEAGQELGKVGRTGNANNVCHVHYGISPPCAKTGDWKVRRGVIWPATYLKSWRSGGDKSPVDTVAAWERENDCEA